MGKVGDEERVKRVMSVYQLLKINLTILYGKHVLRTNNQRNEKWTGNQNDVFKNSPSY